MAYSLVMRTKLAGIATALLLVLAACGSSNGLDTLHKESFQSNVGIWPLTVDEATPICGTKNSFSVGVEANGIKYALNGTAKTWEHWADLHAIWAPDPSIKGGYLNEGDLLDYVQSKCDAAN